MVTTGDRDYFRRVAAALARYDVGRAPESLEEAIAATQRLRRMALVLGRAARVRADDLASHLALYERARALRRD